MKKTILLAAMVVSAATSVAQDFKEIDYTVSGKVSENVKMVYFVDDGEREYSDSAVVKDGAFEYKGMKPEYSLVTAVAGREELKFFCDNTPVVVDFTENTISGSDLNNKFNLCQTKTDAIYSKIIFSYAEYKIISAGNDADKEERMSKLEDEMNKLEAEYNSTVLEIIKENKDNFIPVAYLGDVAYELSYTDLKSLLSENASFINHPSPSVKKAMRILAGMEKRQPGTMFVDLTIPGIDGKERKLSDWCGKGNYVLIDFWASWCGPCRMEMPNVVANYEKYHSKGFEIIGISFDNKGEAWKKAVMDLGMKWPQVSNLKGWQSAGAAEYGIMSIPASILLDGEGKIVAIDLRGNALGNKLKEIYGF